MSTAPEVASPDAHKAVYDELIQAARALAEGELETAHVAAKRASCRLARLRIAEQEVEFPPRVVDAEARVLFGTYRRAVSGEEGSTSPRPFDKLSEEERHAWHEVAAAALRRAKLRSEP